MCRVPARAPRSIADVFSGSESVTPLLARRFPDAEIEAFELSQSDGRFVERLPGRVLGQGSTARLSARKNFDLICSNGSLPSSRDLLPQFAGLLIAGGWLAVQIPNDLYEPSRALARMIATDGPWARKLLPIVKTRPFNESMESLYSLLGPTSASVDIWEATYLHVMSSVASIVELMETTRLAPFLGPLNAADRRKFLALYAAELKEAYPAQPDGSVLLRVRRLFVVAQI
jgi:trans-aconitate 2-methyltransferase